MDSVQNDGKSFSLKDQLFNEDKVNYLASLVSNVYVDFDSVGFVESIMDELLDLELKERMTLISEKLFLFLPKDFYEATNIMINSLPSAQKTEHKDDFIFGPYCEYAQRYGCNEINLKQSFLLMEKTADYFSSEFAIRDFINLFPVETMDFLEMMSYHKDFMCNRLASEGLRPKLPWAKKINYDYKEGAKLLSNLFYNKHRIVTRSVANHLNDISKFDNEFVLNLLGEWKKSGKQNEIEMDYIINHSLRGLIKAGDKKTMEFLGYSTSPKVCVLNFNLGSEKIKLGSHLEFDFDILSETDEKLIIDYRITYPNPSGRLSTKVFKIKKYDICAEHGKVNFTKKHKFVSMSTKKLYAGMYKLELMINGVCFLEREFELVF